MHCSWASLSAQVEGSAHSGGRIAYVPQTAWCQNLSLRDNITFGQAWNGEKYKQVGGSSGSASID